MSESQQEDHETRPLLPRRHFALSSWFKRRWIRDPIPDVESPSPSEASADRLDVVPSASPSPSMPPAPPNTPPEPESELRPPESSAMAQRPSTTEKICLICLEPLLPEEFESGEAMEIKCQCKGDAALRHRSCAQKWVDIKGDLTCDVCRAPITNLDAPRPRSEAGSQLNSDDPTDASRGRYPSATDVFDCIRMTWIVTIVCILFAHFSIPTSLITGLLIAVMYTWSCQLLRCANTQVENTMQEQQEQQNQETTGDHLRVPAIVIV